MLKRITSFLYWGALALALIGLATQIYPALSDYYKSAKIALTYPYSIDYGEGPILDQTLHLAKFENIYKSSFATPPYTIANYPPLYPLLQVPFAWIFGPAFWYGRMISLLSIVLTAVFMCLTLYVLTHNWVGAGVGALLLLVFPYIQHWSMFTRVDGLALVFSWAGLYVIVGHVGQSVTIAKSGRTAGVASVDEIGTLKETIANLSRGILSRGSFWLAALLLLAAIYSRQTYALAAPVAAFFWLIFGSLGSWKKRFIQAVWLGIVVLGLTLILFAVIDLATAGGFYLNIVVSNVNKFVWDTVWHYEKEIQDKMWPLVGLAGLFLVSEAIIAIIRWAVRLYRRLKSKPGQSQARQRPTWRASAWALVLPYLVASAAGSITIGKDGSNVNYLYELSAAMSLAGGAALAATFQWKRWYARLPLHLVVIGLLAYQCNLMVDLTRKNYNGYLQDRVTHIADVSAVEKIVQDTPGIVLADEYMGLIPLAGKELYLQPFEYKQIIEGGLWDETPLIQDILQHKFDVILWYIPPSWRDSIQARWTAGQRSTILMAYKLDQKIGDVYVYRPK